MATATDKVLITSGNRKQMRAEEEEERLAREIEELEKQNRRGPRSEEGQTETDQTEAEEASEDLDPEERTYKKRYSDLRSHTTKEINKLKGMIESMQKEKTAEPYELPMDTESLKEQMKKNPDLASFVRALVQEEAKKLVGSKDYEPELTPEEKYTQTVKAIKKEHSDFESITKTEEFHSWVESQPEQIQEWVYDSNDAQKIIWALNAYKAFNQIPTDKQKKIEERASEVPDSKAEARVPPGKRKFRESDVAKMSDREYAKFEEEIEKAQAEGRFIWDLSGEG